MSRRCTVCDHPKKREIDRALISGNSLSHTAVVFDLTVSSLFRHRKEHLAALLAKAKSGDLVADAIELQDHQRSIETEETSHALDMRQQLKVINAASLEVLRQARADAKGGTLLQAVDRIHRQIALQAQLLGAPVDDEVGAESMLSQWTLIRQVVLDALRPFPEARVAVAEALGTLNEVNPNHVEH